MTTVAEAQWWIRNTITHLETLPDEDRQWFVDDGLFDELRPSDFVDPDKEWWERVLEEHPELMETSDSDEE